MVPRHLGPLEFVVAPLIDGHPDPKLLLRLSELIHAGGLRVMDLVITTRNPEGAVSWSDVDDAEFSLAGIDLAAPGVISEEDIHEVLARVSPGGWAVILVEHTWDSPRDYYRSPGATVISVAHIPADIAAIILEELNRRPTDTPDDESR